MGHQGARRIGSAAGSGAQPTLARTPVRGFPPAPPGSVRAPGPGGPGPGDPGPGDPGPGDPGPGDPGPGGPSAGSGGPSFGGPGPADGSGYAGSGAPGAGSGPADGSGYAGPEPPEEIAFRDPAAPGRGRRGRETSRTARPRRRARRVALLAAAVVVLAAGAFAGYKYLYEPRVNAPVSGSLRLPTTAPGSAGLSSPGFDRALGKWQHIGTSAEDPAPLTLAELYPPQFVLDGSSYSRTAASATKNCSVAVYGSQLQAALQSGHCTQVLRASYLSGNGTMMGTIGVVNLNTSAAAQAAGQVTGPQEIIAPLSGQKGATSKLGNGTGVVQAEIKGHYLILMWAEFANLNSPSTSAARHQLEQFAADVVTGSANIDLSTRMLTGKA